MQTGFGLVQHHHRRRTRGQQRRQPQQVAQRAVRKFRSTQSTQQAVLAEFKGESAVWQVGNFQTGAGKRRVHSFRNGIRVSCLNDSLDGRGQVAAIMPENRRAGAEFGNPARSVRIRAQLIVETPASNPFAQQQNFGGVVRIGNLDEDSFKEVQPSAIVCQPFSVLPAVALRSGRTQTLQLSKRYFTSGEGYDACGLECPRRAISSGGPKDRAPGWSSPA